jgi:hypothetical protein
MKLGTLAKRALYRELYSAIGYHDARRVLKLIEEDLAEKDGVEGLNSLLEEHGFDRRQKRYIMDAVNNLGFLSKEPARQSAAPTS